MEGHARILLFLQFSYSKSMLSKVNGTWEFFTKVNIEMFRVSHMRCNCANLVHYIIHMEFE